jgi:hypothetical protein
LDQVEPVTDFNWDIGDLWRESGCCCSLESEVCCIVLTFQMAKIDLLSENPDGISYSE